MDMLSFNYRKVSNTILSLSITLVLVSCGIDEDKERNCTTEKKDNGTLIKCTDSETFVKNGERGSVGKAGDRGETGEDGERGSVGIDGAKGEPGIDGKSFIVKIIDPCGDSPKELDEVILQIDTGEFLAYFESSGARHLAILPDGDYITTDNSQCPFTVKEGEIIF